MRILTTGNPAYGIAQAISEVIGGDFASRATGHDLCSDDGRNAFVEMSLGYDVVINSAALWRFNQSVLLEKLHTRWLEMGKKGHIISLGSTADTGTSGKSWLYPIEKKALRDLSRNLSYMAIGDCGIRVSYVSLGYVATPKVETKHPFKRKLQPNEVANLIKWVIDTPSHLNLNEISIDPIQTRV